jgi:hypothetical protein
MAEDTKVRFTEEEKPPLTRSRSVSPTRGESKDAPEHPVIDGWSKELEILMSEWSDLALCYKWLHEKSEALYHIKNLGITIPVIVLSTLGGTASFGVQSFFSTDQAKQYASFAIGSISLIAGLMTTIGNYLRYAQSEEGHRVAAIAWGKLQRLIAVELALKPSSRIDPNDFLKMCRTELDRMIEQSPPIPEEIVALFKTEFKDLTGVKRPEICGTIEHTRTYQDSGVRLRQIASDAAMMLKHKKNALTEFMTPHIQAKIKEHIDAHLEDAIERRKQELQEELDRQKEDAKRREEEYHAALAERQRKLQEEIETEKARIASPMKTATAPAKFRPSFQDRLAFKSNPLFKSSLSTGGTPITSPRDTPLFRPSVAPPSLPPISSLPPTPIAADPPVNLVIIPRAGDSGEK